MTRGDDYLWDRSGDEPDPEVAGLEQLLGGLAHDAPLAPLPPRRPSRRRPWAAAIGVLAVAAAVIAIVLATRGGSRAGVPVAVAGCADRGGPGFRFAVHGDGARCGGEPTTAGVLPPGAWLETGAGAEAAVRIADLGDVTLYGDSRLRAVATGPRQHRLELARGKLRAKVDAPPRLFVVDTPAAAAVDLGCAYELEVDERGQTRLFVTMGVVSLEGGGHAAYVPAGVEVETVGGGPGTPVRRAASPALRDAVTRFDHGEARALADIVSGSGECDTITLWNLLARTDGDGRRAVFGRLDALAIRPEWVLDRDVLAGAPEALEAWRRDLDGSWTVGLSATANACLGPGTWGP
jgi:ferric-dicitrate binding protein FerR (iron transport regulator)